MEKYEVVLEVEKIYHIEAERYKTIRIYNEIEISMNNFIILPFLYCIWDKSLLEIP